MRYRDSDGAVVRQVFSRREYDLAKFPQERRIQAAYDAALKAGSTPVIIDCGANIGAAAIWFAQRYPKAQIVSIEPDPGNAQLCRQNVAAFPNIRVVEGAIGSQPGSVEIANPTGESYALRTERNDLGTTPVHTIADLRALVAPDAPLLLVKIDIEGFEADLFSSNTDWLGDVTAVIVEPHDWMLPGQRSSGSLQRAVFSRDFEMLIHRESLVFVR
jgi:FkbM family methyltransferase